MSTYAKASHGTAPARTRSALRCPRCQLVVAPRIPALVPRHCPRCLAGRRLVVEFEQILPASRVRALEEFDEDTPRADNVIEESVMYRAEPQRQTYAAEDAASPSRSILGSVEAERFIATVSHDLESSLLVLATRLELLRSGDLALDSEQEEQLAGLERTVERMGRLLSGIRSFVRTGGEMEHVRVQLAKVVADATEGLSPLIDERSANIVVETPLPTVTGDPGQLLQLFQNLLSNAVKFGPPGGHVRISATRDGSSWRIAVADEGPGIAPGHREQVFEPFRRLRETGHVPGTGLGLAICRQVANNHRGWLAIESSPTGEATFVLTLPDRRLAPVP